MKVPNEIKEKILLASEYYEKAWAAECELRGWLKQVGLAKDLEETPIEEALINCTRLGDGSPKSFITLLEGLEDEERINWEAEEPIAICYFSVDENRDGEVWFECMGHLFKANDSGADGVPAWELVEFVGGERFRLGFNDLSWLEEEPESWDGDEERDKVDYLTNEEAAEYHLSFCSGKRLLPTEADFATPCGNYYFTI